MSEYFTKKGDLLSYYPIQIAHFIGVENYHMIPKLATVMSRTMLVNDEPKGIDYYMSLHPREWNEYAEHLDLPRE